MPISAIPLSSVKVILHEKSPPLDERLRFGVDWFVACLKPGGQYGERFNGFGPHAMFFAQCESPIDIFELIWISTESTHLRSDYLTVLRTVINRLPPWNPDLPGDTHDLPAQLRSVAIPLIAFVAKSRAVDVIASLRAKSFGRSGWMQSRELQTQLLIAALAMDYSHDVNEMLGQFIDSPELLRRLDFHQFGMLSCAFVAGLPHLANTTENVEQAKERLIKLADSISVDHAARPYPVLPDLTSRDAAFREIFVEVKAALHNGVHSEFDPFVAQIMGDLAVQRTGDLMQSNKAEFAELIGRTKK